jgi:ribosomal RNA-processing protein 12
MEHIEEIQFMMTEAFIAVLSSSKKNRLKCMELIIDILPTPRLTFIPSILGEIILSTKEVNEKTRHLAYHLLVRIGHKMKEENGAATSHGNDIVPIEDASITQFFKMILAGLAGTTPRMVGATILAMARILYEFHQEADPSCLKDIIQSMLFLLQSRNCEIAKAAMGFLKVAICCLSVEALTPHLQNMIGLLLEWSDEHRHHFKKKIRTVLEQLIRKFGYETIEKLIPIEHQKLLTNIKKTKIRIEKKKKQGQQENTTLNSSFSHQTINSKEQTEDPDDNDDDSDDSDDSLSQSPMTYASLTHEKVSRKKQRNFSLFMEKIDNDPFNLLES